MPGWKALGGLRYDNMDGRYNAYAVPDQCRDTGHHDDLPSEDLRMSYRAAVLFQPNELHSYHLSYGTSFHTSGDTLFVQRTERQHAA